MYCYLLKVEPFWGRFFQWLHLSIFNITFLISITGFVEQLILQKRACVYLIRYKLKKKDINKMKTFIAMNRFKIAIGKEKDFENIWRNRETHLDDVGGFKNFNLLKGPTNEKYTLYTSHSTWDSKTDFENWTKSEAFRKAHSGGGQHKGIYLGHPQFEGFEVIL